MHYFCTTPSFSGRDVSSTLKAGRRLPLSTLRRRAIARGKSHGVEVTCTQEFSQFMAITEANLRSRYSVRPVHTAAEMQLLANRFPENIKLLTAEPPWRNAGGNCNL